VIDCHIDIETASELDLRECGVDAYSRHSSTRILMCSWRIGEQPIRTWTCEDGGAPPELIKVLLDPGIRKWAHNATFERVLFMNVWKLHLPIAQWRCTMAWAFMLGLPGGLDHLGEVLLLPEHLKKGKDGLRLMKIFSMPHKPTKKRPDPWRNATTDPEEWAKFVAYNVQDVVAESFIAEHRLNRYVLPENEWVMWEIDQEINERGLPIDRDLVTNAVVMVEEETANLMMSLRDMRGLENPNSDKQFGPWIRAQGFPFNDLKKATVARVMLDEDFSHIKVALQLRAQLKRTSVKKFFAVQESVAADDRLRYTFQFCGASRTGRWAGRGAHFHNPAKPSKELAPYSTDIIASVRAGDTQWIMDMYGSPMHALSSVVRGMVRARPGHILKVADLASIESRVIAWLARCPALMQVFLDGLDVYQSFATYLYRTAPPLSRHKLYSEITKEERNLAKPPVLGCGFRLSGGEDMISPKTGDPIKTGLYGYAENMGIPMTRDEAHYAVGVFREAYPEIVQFWYDLEAAAMHVIQRGGTSTCGHLTFDMLGPFMRMILPSGRALHYLRPKIEKRMMPWGKEKWSLTFEGEEDLGDGRKRWGRQATHGGKLAENGTQAVANDILRDGIIEARDIGFHIVGHSHDEDLAEEPVNSTLTVADLCKAMTRPLLWAPGLPLGAAGYEATTYRKD
jgi:DNA polymerase